MVIRLVNFAPSQGLNKLKLDKESILIRIYRVASFYNNYDLSSQLFLIYVYVTCLITRRYSLLVLSKVAALFDRYSVRMFAHWTMGSTIPIMYG